MLKCVDKLFLIKKRNMLVGINIVYFFLLRREALPI